MNCRSILEKGGIPASYPNLIVYRTDQAKGHDENYGDQENWPFWNLDFFNFVTPQTF